MVLDGIHLHDLALGAAFTEFDSRRRIQPQQHHHKCLKEYFARCHVVDRSGAEKLLTSVLVISTVK